MRDEQDGHALAGPQGTQQIEDLAPVGQGQRVTAGIAAIDLFDRRDVVLPAQVVEDQSLQPVEAVDYDGLVVVRLGQQLGQRLLHVLERCGQGELGAVDLSQAVLGLYEDRLWRLGGEGRFADTFRAVNDDSGWRALTAVMDVGK
jgi:hypothetical protein